MHACTDRLDSPLLCAHFERQVRSEHAVLLRRPPGLQPRSSSTSCFKLRLEFISGRFATHNSENLYLKTDHCAQGRTARSSRQRERWRPRNLQPDSSRGRKCVWLSVCCVKAIQTAKVTASQGKSNFESTSPLGLCIVTMDFGFEVVLGFAQLCRLGGEPSCFVTPPKSPSQTATSSGVLLVFASNSIGFAWF